MAFAQSGTALAEAAAREDFANFLPSAKRILALVGAGLSASSGLPTFRGAGGLWRNHDAVRLATPEAFSRDPGLVWQFYSYRRHMALKVNPNPGHYALAKLARNVPGFMTLSQNVDGLSQRARHPTRRLMLLHGNLYDLKCSGRSCSYRRENDFTDPIVEALAIPTIVKDGKEVAVDPTSNSAMAAAGGQAGKTSSSIEIGTRLQEHERLKTAEEVDISDANIDIPKLTFEDLPLCPKCKSNLLRPGVVWFGEALPGHVMVSVKDWIADSPQIDLILVIGTSARVFPAAEYVETARRKGARVAVINMDRGDEPPTGMTSRDWFFQGDAAQILPEILKPLIGKVEVPDEERRDVT